MVKLASEKTFPHNIADKQKSRNKQVFRYLQGRLSFALLCAAYTHVRAFNVKLWFSRRKAAVGGEPKVKLFRHDVENWKSN